MTQLRLRRAWTIVVVALLGVAVAFAGLAEAGAARRGLTIYAVGSKAQFTNHADDRERGLAKNPFNFDMKIQPPKGKGPQAGDKANYSFKLYSDPSLKKLIGSAVYSCTFNFGHEALCQADFELNNGAMIASGPADFDTTSFTLAVSGGSGKYLGARGQVSSAPHLRDSHRLTFVLR